MAYPAKRAPEQREPHTENAIGEANRAMIARCGLGGYAATLMASQRPVGLPGMTLAAQSSVRSERHDADGECDRARGDRVLACPRTLVAAL